jgi:DNA topoisomerase-1
MKLVVAEKSIAGQRIAELLADANVKTTNVSGNRVFVVNHKGEELKVIPLRGHISDVEFPKKYSNWRTIPIPELIDAPIYYSKKEYRIIDSIMHLAPDAEEVIIATDADREGESIGLEALNYAKQTNKSIKVTRAYFSAITKQDIEKSFSELEKFDYNFAYSANARREIDLIWGAALTRFVSLSTGQVGKNFLSVGRVQTPTLALVVERERQRREFKSSKYFEVIANCKKDDIKFEAIHKLDKFDKKEDAKKIIDKNISELIVKKVDKKTKTLKRPVPFNTTEYLRAATAIGLSAGKAMSIAESLYQRGFTSYPRTDSKAYPKNLDLMSILKKLENVSELSSDVKKVLSQEKIVPSKGKETKDHPPIHPVMGVNKNILAKDEWKVYELIVRRFLATLYKDASTENTLAILNGKEEDFIARGQTIIDKGWKEIYFYSKIKEAFLPNLNVDDLVKVEKMDLNEKETQAPGRYSQGSLIKLMEKHNLGTKSTRPAIIQKLYQRKYISGNKSIEASDLAFAVINSLSDNCPLVTKPKMTAELENEMDEIAAGKKEQNEVVNDSKKRLHNIIKILEGHKDDLKKAVSGSVTGLRSSGKKVIGKCDKCGNDLVIRKSKAGKRFLGCSNYPNCTNTYSLPQKGTIAAKDEFCKVCKYPIIKVKKGNFNYEMCLNMNCKTKESWGKKS